MLTRRHHPCSRAVDTPIYIFLLAFCLSGCSLLRQQEKVGSDGFLHYFLSNDPGKPPYQVSFPEQFLMISVQNTKEQAPVITGEVKVEKKLNMWQRFRTGAFWWFLSLVLFAYRKQIIAAIMKAFGHY